LPGAILGLASEGVSGLIFTVEFVVAAADDEEDVARTGIGLAIGAAAFCGGGGGGGGGGGCDDDDAALLPDNAVAADFLPDDDDDVEEAVCSLVSPASPWAELTCWIIIACRRNTCMHPSKMHAYTSPRSVAIRGLLCWESGGGGRGREQSLVGNYGANTLVIMGVLPHVGSQTTENRRCCWAGVAVDPAREQQPVGGDNV